MTLVIKGYVKKFATIRPKRVQLNGTLGETIRKTVAIIPEKDYPFTITEKSARKGDEIDFTLKEKPGKNGTEYELIVENKRQKAGQYHDVIDLITDSPLKPKLQIRVYANIQSPKKEEKPAPEAHSPSPKSSKSES